MPTFEIISLIVLGLLAWLWLDSIKVRDIGIRAAKVACHSEGFQLLDDTVSIARVALTRDGDGAAALRRVYNFDYTDTGDNRRNGSLVMIGSRVLVVNIGLRAPLADISWH